MLTAVIFDMDGTLFQTNKILELALDDTFQYLKTQNKWHSASPIEQYREIMGVPLPTVWETLMPNHSLEDRELTDQYFLQRLIHHIKEGHGALYDDVEDVFNYLQQNEIQIFIASNGLVRYLEAIVEHYQLKKWLTELFSIEQITTLNKSELVSTIIKKYNLTAIAVVGDRLSDIMAAKDNQLIAIGCNFDFAKEDELKQADYIINNLKELKTLIQTL